MSHKKRCFVILTPGFPADENDTTCLPAFQQFALSLKKLWPDIQIIVLTFQYPFTKKKYNWNEIQVISLGGQNKPKFFRLLTWIRAMRELRGLNNAYNINGLFSLWLTECSLIGKRFASKNNLKHFMWLIGQDAKLTNQYIKRINPKGEQIIAMSDFLQQEFYRNFKIQPKYIVTNGINKNIFDPLNIGERTIDVFGAGSLIPLKNYTLFIEIVEQLVQNFPSLVVKIAGDGIDRETLKNLIQEKNLSENIELLGSISHTKTLQMMNQSKIFLHTSYYEGNSTVLMEALYSGCYVYSTQGLSNSNTPHLTIAKEKKELVEFIQKQLLSPNQKAERIIFNTMDDSAKKIESLFLS